MHCVQIMPWGISYTYHFVRRLLPVDSAWFLIHHCLFPEAFLKMMTNQGFSTELCVLDGQLRTI